MDWTIGQFLDYILDQFLDHFFTNINFELILLYTYEKGGYLFLYFKKGVVGTVNREGWVPSTSFR